MRLLILIAGALTIASAAWRLLCRRSDETALWLAQDAYVQHG